MISTMTLCHDVIGEAELYTMNMYQQNIGYRIMLSTVTLYTIIVIISVNEIRGSTELAQAHGGYSDDTINWLRA